MTSISKPIVFFGTEDFSLATLQALIDADYPVRAVVTKPDQPKGRGHHVIAPPVKVIAQQHNIAVWQPQRLADIADDITALGDPIGVLVSYGKIIPQGIIDLFSPGIINVHPSLLPLYRGPSPIEAAILGGDQKTGISIMQLSAAMDAGPVYTQVSIPLTGSETATELYQSFGAMGAKLLVEVLPRIINGSLTGTPQQDDQATYCSLITKADGHIDWQDPAATIDRQIRAYIQWPQSRARIGQLDVIITQAEITDTPSSETPGSLTLTNTDLFVHTGDYLLRITSLKPLGKKEMPVQAFLAGYRAQLTD